MIEWETRCNYQGDEDDAVRVRDLLVATFEAAGIAVRTTTARSAHLSRLGQKPAPMSHAPGRSSEHAFQMVSKTMGARPS